MTAGPLGIGSITMAPLAERVSAYLERVGDAIHTCSTNCSRPEHLVYEMQREIDRLQAFARGMLDLCPFDECEGVQELAVQQGVLVEVAAAEPCGEDCKCAWVTDFPAQCFRLAPSLATAGGGP